MKLTTAALALLATVDCTSAFLQPSVKRSHGGLSPSSFGVRPGEKRKTWALPSTTTKRNDIEVVPASEITQIMGDNGVAADSAASKFNSHAVSPDAVKNAAAQYIAKYKGESGASVVYSKLQEYGVKVVNGYSGGAVLPLLDQFHVDHPRHAESGKTPITWITNSNESSAGHIAEGYAKSFPQDEPDLPVGVAVATSGPGVTNLITPLQDAICDGVPIVVLCGQAATVAPKDAFQSSPAVAMTTPCTKWSYQIKSAAEIPFVMDYAFYVARHGRPGPVFVDLPKDLQNQVVNDDLIQSFVEDTLGQPESDDSSKELNRLARIVERRRGNGSSYQAIQLGTNGNGLSFELDQQQFPGTEFALNAVTDDYDCDYHADHRPTNKVYQYQSDGEEAETTINGDLTIDSPMFQEMYKVIKTAKKPVIIAGMGCNDCPEELKAFAEALQIPVTSTLHALGAFDERHPLALNMMGMHGHPTPNFLVQESDLLITVGSRFDDRITGRMSEFARPAFQAGKEGRGGIIHVDLRLSERAAQVKPTYFVHSRGSDFLKTVNEAIKNDPSLADRKKTLEWVEHMKALQKDYPILIPKFETQKIPDPENPAITRDRTPMSAQYVVQELNNQLLQADKMDEAIFSTGVGIHQMVAAQLITWTKPRQMLSSGSLGTMGVALGYAVGAKLANGKKIVIAIDGDGSFNMTFTELKTVAERNIPVKIMILDNEAQMMVEYWQRLFHNERYLAVRNEKNPKYTVLADAFGIKNIYCDAAEDLPAAMAEFLFADPDEPVLFHVRIERTPCLPLVAPGEALENMILEDTDFECDASAAPS